MTPQENVRMMRSRQFWTAVAKAVLDNENEFRVI